MAPTRIVLVTTRVAVPPTRGQQVRTDEWLRALAGHELALVCPRPRDATTVDAVARLGVEAHWYPYPASDALRAVVPALTRGLPAQEGVYRTPAAAAAMTRALEQAPADLVIVQTVRCCWAAEWVGVGSGRPPVLFDAIDSMALHYRHRARSAPVHRRWALLSESARCERRERWIAGRADLSVAVSDRDLEAFAPVGRGRVVVVSGRTVELADPVRPTEPVVLLSGNLGYRPTVDAALWFAREVWPHVRAARPDARWVLAGARPAARIRRLAERPGVEVHAEPPDLAPFLARAAVAVAPMATGSGIPLKVIEAWAAGVPVVAAPWAAAGLGAGAEEALAVADGAEAFADAIVRLLSEPEEARRLAAAGRDRWVERYRPESVAEAIRAVVAELV